MKIDGNSEIESLLPFKFICFSKYAILQHDTIINF